MAVCKLGHRPGHSQWLEKLPATPLKRPPLREKQGTVLWLLPAGAIWIEREGKSVRAGPRSEWPTKGSAHVVPIRCSEGGRGQGREAKLWGSHGQGYSYQEQPSRLPVAVRPNMRQGFVKSSLHLFGSRLRSDLRGHMVQVLPKILGVPSALKFKGARHDMGKVAFGRHTGRASLRFKRGGILFRQVNCQVHRLLLQLNPDQSTRDLYN